VPALLGRGYEVLELSRSRGVDLMNFDWLQGLPQCDFIIHLAARTFVPDSFIYPKAFFEFNLGTTLNVLELARIWQAKMIYMSSYLYGNPQYIPVDESHPARPHNPYAQSKLMAEQLCEAYSRDFKVTSIVLRLFNIYGPGQKGAFLIPEILQKIKSGHLALKDPRPKRDYVYIDDVVRAVCLCLETECSGYDVFNLATGISHTVEDVVKIISKYSSIPFTVSYSNEYREGEVLDAAGNAEKLKKFIGIENFIGLEEGLKKMIS
jgi:UDP-glucose 4-epimerase